MFDNIDMKNVCYISLNYDTYEIIKENNNNYIILDKIYNLYRIVTKMDNLDYFICKFMSNKKTYSNKYNYVLEQFNNIA